MLPIHDYRLISVTSMSCILSIVLCIITFLFFTNVPEFSSEGDELLNNTHFSNQLDSWITKGKGIQHTKNGYKRTVLLESKSPTQTLTIYQRHKKSELPKVVILSALIKTTNVSKGKKDWNKARFLFVGVDADNKRLWDVPHSVISLTGTSEWNRYSKAFETSQSSISYDILATVSQAKGKMWLSDISLKAATPNPIYSPTRLVLISIWGLFIIYLIFPLSKTYNGLKSPPSITMILVPVILIALLAILPVSIGSTASYFAHLTGFFLITLMALSIFKSQPYKVFFTLTLLTVITEILQYFVPNRTPDINDVFIDFFGVVFGFIAYNLHNKLRQLRQKQ